MGFYDEQIKKADREIEKLLSDIEKKKSRIAELRLFKKDCEAKRQRDDTYSNSLLQVLADGGIKSDEQRKEILLHLQEYISARNVTALLNAIFCFFAIAAAAPTQASRLEDKA